MALRTGQHGARTGAGALLFALRAAALAAVWLALTDSRNLHEWVAGAVAVLLTLGLIAVVRRPRAADTLARLRVPLRLGSRVLRPVWQLVRDSLAVCALAARSAVRGRPIAGRFRAARYSPDAARRNVGGRVLTEALGSLAPNRYVVGIDDDGVILVHELRPSDDPVDPLAP